ncbi:MAG: hypothetical protein ACJAXB_000712 [Candidatus Endobugula sp.]|jgi:hypothetical protein
MVKNSKFLLYLLGLVISINLSAQLKSEGLSPVKRDMEITRVTLENFLKQYDEAVLLNQVKESSAVYINGKGIEITLQAPNASIILNTNSGRFSTGDFEILDTFYTDEMIALQKSRLEEATKKFIADYYTYLPKLASNETFNIVFNIEDPVIKINGEEVPPSGNASKRTYQLKATWSMSDMEALNQGSINEEQLLKRIKIEKQ